MRKQITLPNQRDILVAFKRDLMANFNCHRVGIIESFDSETQTATISIVDKRVIFTYEDQAPILKDYSLLVDCPVRIDANKTSGFTRPIEVGDECMVLFNDRDIDNWFKFGTVGQPRSNRMHDLSDGLAIVGFHSELKKLTNFSNDSIKMYFEENAIEISATSAKMSFGDTVVELDDKVKIKNETQNLKELIDELFTILTNLKTVDPISGDLPIDATTASDLATLKTKFDSLLK